MFRRARFITWLVLVKLQNKKKYEAELNFEDRSKNTINGKNWF